MNINTVILDQISDYLYEYSNLFRSDFSFIEEKLTYEERQDHSTNIIKRIMMANGKQELFEYIADLAKIEKHTKALSTWQRDHVYHAVLTYLIGILLNEKFINTLVHKKVSDFQWKLAGLFHDIGYPVQIVDNILNHVNERIAGIDKKVFESKRDEIFQRLQTRKFFGVTAIDLEILTNNQNSLSLIQYWITKKWGLDVDAKHEYNLLQSGQRTCHGVASSLMLLHVIDVMYDVWNPERLEIDVFGDPPKSDNINWNQKNFLNEVVPACAAIFIHNLPEDRFTIKKIDPKKADLPFLLKLCDTLQEWQRPQGEKNSGHSPFDFRISINNGRLKFAAKDPIISEKVENDLRKTILVDSIEIINV